jgi:hypothetical protein
MPIPESQHSHIFFEQAYSFGEVKTRVEDIAKQLAAEGCIVVSVSHAHGDPNDSQGAYEFVVVGRSLNI